MCAKLRSPKVRLAGLLLGAAIAAVFGGCSGTAPTSSPAGQTSVAQVPEPTPRPFRIVGIGDSYMAAQNADGRSFMRLFGAQIEEKLSRPAEVTVFAEGDSTSASVVSDLRNVAELRTAVAKADIIVISVGSNDVDPFGSFPKGTCAPGQARSSCLEEYAPALTGNYEAIFAELGKITRGHLPAVRVTSVDNPFIGMPDAPSPTFGQDFFAQAAEAETEAIFAVAAKHGARSIDYLHVFGGPDGLQDPAKYLAGDHAHPGDLGIQKIADLLTETGPVP